MKNFQNDFDANCKSFESVLRTGKSFDIITRRILSGGRRTVIYSIDGFGKEDVMEKMMEFIMSLKPEDLDSCQDTSEFASRFITYIETRTESALDNAVAAILAGCYIILVEGFPECIVVEARTYPARSVDEPETDRALRGSHDGFVETMLFNTAMIRRRIRDPRLTFQLMTVGEMSKTDIAVGYMEGIADPKRLEKVFALIGEAKLENLAMGQETLAEAIVKPQWWNPFPKVRYTERPDSAAACLAEGCILILVDNSPSVMILPTSLFDFTQEINDFYFPPLTGSYLRIIRHLVFLMVMLLTPVWYLLLKNPGYIPPWLDFIKIKEPNTIPILLQLLLTEFVIDGLKLASLNTPSALSNSFSIIGALLLGDFAVQAGWIVPEVILYMAFVSIAAFTQPSFELGYAVKFYRVLTLILIGLANLWGFIAGILLMLISIAATKPIGGGSYLYPLIPFNGKALLSLFIRRPLTKSQNYKK